MNHKLIRFALLAGVLFFMANAARAQDRIYLEDGTIIEAKVKEISPRSIVYRRWDNQEGADYILTRREVSRIVYQNGAEEKLVNRSEREIRFSKSRDADLTHDRGRSTGRREQRGMDPAYGKNILAIAPLQMTNESVAGFGVQYERVLDKAGIFSLYLPVAFSFFDDEVNNPVTGTLPLKATRVFTYLYPGAKFYPGGSGHRASYSVGPSFGFGFGTKYQQTRSIDPGTGSVIFNYNEASVFKAGFMINNGLNIQPTQKLYVGLEIGLGLFYYSNEQQEYNYGGGGVSDEPIVQFNFKMGYRF